MKERGLGRIERNKREMVEGEYFIYNFLRERERERERESKREREREREKMLCSLISGKILF